MTPVFGYLRVSGKGQIEGDGFERQKTTILDYCARKGFKVIRWFQDGAVSGTVDAEDRPAFGEMCLLCGPATTMTIVVERSDRLARTLMVSEFACAEARKSGLTILEAASDTDLTNSDDPTRVLIRQVLGALAEWNKNVMVKRLAAARQRVREKKGHCEGRRPFGWRNEKDAEAVALIWELRQQNWSLREIMRSLEERKFIPPEGNPQGHWSTSTIRRIIAREKNKRKRQPKVDAGLLDGLPA